MHLLSFHVQRYKQMKTFFVALLYYITLRVCGQGVLITLRMESRFQEKVKCRLYSRLVSLIKIKSHS